MKRILILCSAFILENASAIESETVVGYDGFYIGAGVEFSRFTNQSEILWSSIVGIFGVKIQQRKINKVGGAFAVGGGRCVVGRCYIGGELSLDISGNTSYNGAYGNRGIVNYNGKLHGIVPSAVVRLGYCLNTSTMAYVRVGGAYVKSDFDDGMGRMLAARHRNLEFYGSEVNISKIVPVVGLGIERQVCGKFGLRLEGDYRFNSKKMSAEIVSVFNGMGVFGLRNRVKNYTVRLMGTYKF